MNIIKETNASIDNIRILFEKIEDEDEILFKYLE